MLKALWNALWIPVAVGQPVHPAVACSAVVSEENILVVELWIRNLQKDFVPISRKDLHANRSELQMLIYSLLFYRQWEWNPVSLRSAGWSSEEKTWHQKSQVIAWLGACGTSSCITVVVCKRGGWGGGSHMITICFSYQNICLTRSPGQLYKRLSLVCCPSSLFENCWVRLYGLYHAEEHL